ncbi:hypothetical protein [Acinetobacter baumannii]|uniref:hypothetical protein n=1 Tax=Acinetobacter baumannii TaxID=470 RepID=UPI001125DBF1|nr:hypothetical protein [Acinetobacter baumannii]EHU3342161.1 hypothetical protein [Acinetobacter baumannii]TPT75951.1 hypothetical protein FJU59_17050 [Acinetobacter baumannii]
MTYVKNEKYEAIEVGTAIQLANTEFKQLPDWFKRAYRQGKILVGSNRLLVSTSKYANSYADDTHTLIKCSDGYFEVIMKDEFKHKYREI